MGCLMQAWCYNFLKNNNSSQGAGGELGDQVTSSLSHEITSYQVTKSKGEFFKEPSLPNGLITVLSATQSLGD